MKWNEISFSFIEIKRQLHLVDNEKENFKTELKESFNEIRFPVHIPDHLKEFLKKEKKENFAKFDEATKEVHQESEYKRNEKRELESFSNEKIDEMMDKNEGMSFFFIRILNTFVIFNGLFKINQTTYTIWHFNFSRVTISSIPIFIKLWSSKSHFQTTLTMQD